MKNHKLWNKAARYFAAVMMVVTLSILTGCASQSGDEKQKRAEDNASRERINTLLEQL